MFFDNELDNLQFASNYFFKRLYVYPLTDNIKAYWVYLSLAQYNLINAESWPKTQFIYLFKLLIQIGRKY